MEAVVVISYRSLLQVFGHILGFSVYISITSFFRYDTIVTFARIFV